MPILIPSRESALALVVRLGRFEALFRRAVELETAYNRTAAQSFFAVGDVAQVSSEAERSACQGWRDVAAMLDCDEFVRPIGWPRDFTESLARLKSPDCGFGQKSHSGRRTAVLTADWPSPQFFKRQAALVEKDRERLDALAIGIDNFIKSLESAIAAAAAEEPALPAAEAVAFPPAAPPKPHEAEAIDFAALALALRKAGKKNPAKLVEFMASRISVTADEIAHEVHGDDSATSDAIRKNINRTNEFLENAGSRLTFRLASDHVSREITPE